MSKNTEELKDVLKVQGVRFKGYGILPKAVMQDKRLTAYSKCIYAYFCTYAGAGTTAFPGVKKICNDLCISEDTFRKHMKLLKDYDYIGVEQVKCAKGKFSRNIYTLVENPSPQTPVKTEIEPSPKSADTDKNRNSKKPTPSNSCTNNNKGFKINSGYFKSNNDFVPNKFIEQYHNFEQRTYTDEEYEQFYSNKGVR